MGSGKYENSIEYWDRSYIRVVLEGTEQSGERYPKGQIHKEIVGEHVPTVHPEEGQADNIEGKVDVNRLRMRMRQRTTKGDRGSMGGTR